MSEPPAPAAAPRPTRRRGRRLAFLLILSLIVLPLLALLAGWSGLRSAAVRREILAKVAAAVEESFGLSLAVEDFSLVGWSGIELTGVRLGAPGKAPLATAGRVRAKVDLFSLRRETAVVRSLEVFSPVIDLSAPFPQLPESEGPPGFEIRRIALHGGTVLGAPLEPPAAEWLTRWRIDGIEASGAFRNGPWELTVEESRARVERPGFPPLPLRLSGRFAQEAAGGPIRIAALQADGDGLHLEGSGSMGFGEGAPVEAVFSTRIEPRLLLAGAPAGGSLEARGDLRLPEATGRVALSARDVPAEALQPYLERELFTDLALAGTVADARADLALGPGTFEKVEGEAEAAWRRGARRLAQMEGRVLASGQPLRLTFSGDLLPDRPGRRHVQGILAAADWTGLAEGTAEDLRAELRTADVAASLAELRALWPRLIPTLPPEIPARGALIADLRLDGRLADPVARLQADWKPEADARVLLRAEGRPSTWTGKAEAEVEGVSTAEARRITGRLSLSGSPRAYQTTLTADATAVSYPPYLQSVDTLHLEAAGALALPILQKRSGGPSFDGTLAATASGLFARPNASNASNKIVRLDRVEIAADGLFRADPLSWTGTAAIDGQGLDVPGTVQAAEIHLKAEDVVAGGTAVAGRLRLDAPRVDLPGAGTSIDGLRLEAEGDRREARILALSGRSPEGGSFDASGRVLLEPLLDEADLELSLTRPVGAVRSAELSASLRSGVVGLSVPRLETEAGRATLKATVPLGALRQIPQLTETLDGLPLELTPGPIALTLEAPELDSERLLAALGLEPRPERVHAGLWTELVFEPAAPAAGRGEIRIDGLRVESPDGRAAIEGPVTARLENGSLEIRPVHVVASGAGIQGAGFDLQGRADLDRSWNPFTDEPMAAVRHLALDAGGTLEAALLNPFLQGGVASGALTFSAEASGPLDGLRGDLQATGAGASFFWASPYATRLQDPEVTVSLRDGRWRIDEAGLFLNGGPVQIAGSGAPGEPVSLEAAFDRVRYRLDYGLTALLSGRLTFRMPPEGRSELSGRVTIDRALLDRDVDLDREVLAAFLGPDDTPGTEESFLSQVDLDLRVATVDGVRIRNNVADLRAGWQPLSVTGTLETPVIQGRVEIDPGGTLIAYAQTVRIDRGSLVFTGDPLLDPRIDLSTTSSLQDPSIARLRGTEESPLALLEGNDPWDPVKDKDPDKPGMDDIVEAGLTSYYSARLASRLGQAVGLERLSIQPVPVFQEAGDPSARLNVGGDLSRNASFALSVDLRNVESRTYLLDLHGVRELPGLTLQGFTNDEGNEGASLQQVLELGGSRTPESRRPRLHRLRLEVPPELPKRSLRRAIRLERRRPVPEHADFDIEIDLAEVLRRRGWPDPRIEIEIVPAGGKKNRVDVNVRIEPGPRAAFAFEGDRPPRRDQEAITALYRPDFYEPAALEEMKAETVRAFRRRGHLEPQVEIEVAQEAGLDRRVTIRSAAGLRAKLTELEIAGLDPAVGRLAATRFPGTLSRAELAAASPGADRRLRDSLRALGYPDARITGRDLEDSGRRLVVRVEPGERQVLGRIEIAGVDEMERERLMALLPFRPGEPARLDRIPEGALRLERFLEDQGFPDVTVRPIVRPGSVTGTVDARFEVTTGSPVRVAAVDFEGGRWTRARQLRRVSGLEPGEPFLSASVEEARARLFNTGVFSRVTADVERAAGGNARVTFSLAERPRFRIGYGVRWESGADQASAVVDLADSNFLGRAMTLGLRGLFEPNDQIGRAWLRTGGLFGTALSLEAYTQVRRFLDEGIVEDSREGALQLAHPFGASLTGRLYLRYLTTHIYEEEPDPFLPPFDLRIDRPYLGLQGIWDTRDDRIDPAAGRFASLDLSGSGPWLGSDFDYARLFGQMSTFRRLSLLGRPVVWAQSVRGGWARASSGQELLRAERFFAGGEFSVRGYETESLGPREILGDLIRPLGGETLFLVNQELRFPLPFDLTGLAFFDAGQVWETTEDLGTDLAKALGLGLRARTPVGLLRLDIGFPLDRREGEESYKLYFGFGNAF
jgi:outer membrane protein insertion porin family